MPPKHRQGRVRARPPSPPNPLAALTTALEEDERPPTALLSAGRKAMACRASVAAYPDDAAKLWALLDRRFEEAKARAFDPKAARPPQGFLLNEDRMWDAWKSKQRPPTPPTAEQENEARQAYLRHLGQCVIDSGIETADLLPPPH